MYVVRRIAPDDCCRDDIPDPHAQYAAAFADRPGAEAHARLLHREFIRGDNGAEASRYNRFASTLASATTLPEPIFRDWLMDAGVEPPDPVEPGDPTPFRAPWMSEADWQAEQRRWAEWWTGLTPESRATRREAHAAARAANSWREWWRQVVAAGRLTPEQTEHFWEGLNLVRFFEVVEVPAEGATPPVGFALIDAYWAYDDSSYSGANDALAVYRTRAAAEAELARRRREFGPEVDDWSDDLDRLVVVEVPLSSCEGGPHRRGGETR